jgi:hypothetical protein
VESGGTAPANWRAENGRFEWRTAYYEMYNILMSPARHSLTTAQDQKE